MNSEERRGKRTASILALLVIAMPLLVFLVSIVSAAVGTGVVAFLFLGIYSVFGWLIYKGYGWARSYLAFVLVLNALKTIVSTLSTVGPFGLIVSVPIAGVLFACGWWVWTSKPLDAYCDYQHRRRNPVLSMSNPDGV